jgi:hypothetical protein
MEEDIPDTHLYRLFCATDSKNDEKNKNKYSFHSMFCVKNY